MPREGDNRKRRAARHARVRRIVVGTADRPRLAVFRSHKHVYAQVVDDGEGATLTAASSADSEIKGRQDGLAKSEVSGLVGELIARRCEAIGVKTVVFDRAGYKYHGRVKALAEAARKVGLKF
jgi:large subunit ribosomal protein L18